jgi:hypothetical protein
MKRRARLGNIGRAVFEGSILSGVPTNRIGSTRGRFRRSTHCLLPHIEHHQPSGQRSSPPTLRVLLLLTTRRESSEIIAGALCIRLLIGTCPTHQFLRNVHSDILVSTNMKSLPQPLCSWCSAEYKRRHPRTEPSLCPACHAQLSNASTETLVRIIAELATYNQVALRLLAEGHQVIEHVRSGLAPPGKRARPQAEDPLANASARSIA